MKRMHPLVLAITTCLVFGLVSTASLSEEKKKSYKDRVAGESAYDMDETTTIKTGEKPVPKYPNATRVEPDQNGNPALAKKRNQMITAFQKGKDEDARLAAEELKVDAKANANDKATASRVLLMLSAKKDNNNHAEVIPMLEELIEGNTLDNNTHYALMFELAQRYLLNLDYQDGLETSDKFLTETKTEMKEILAVKGNSLYRLKRVPEAIVVLEKVRAMDANDVATTQMLVKAYSENNQPAKAAELIKTLSQSVGSDRETRVNLAITYRDAKQLDQAADVIAELRSAQQLTEERDYLTAITVYAQMKDREADTIIVVEEGLQKGALKPTSRNFNTLAEAYFYSGNISKALENWTKAAPLSKDGTTYLNLAVVQCQEDMWAACKGSAMKAIEKGGIAAKDAWLEISKAETGLGNTAAAAEARRKSGR